MTIFGREPAFIIGVIASAVLAVIQTFMGQGIISDVVGGRLTDFVNALAQIVTLLLPLIGALLIRGQVTPTASPSLPLGTSVTTPSGGNATVAPN